MWSDKDLAESEPFARLLVQWASQAPGRLVGVSKELHHSSVTIDGRLSRMQKQRREERAQMTVSAMWLHSGSVSTWLVIAPVVSASETFFTGRSLGLVCESWAEWKFVRVCANMRSTFGGSSLHSASCKVPSTATMWAVLTGGASVTPSLRGCSADGQALGISSLRPLVEMQVKLVIGCDGGKADSQWARKGADDWPRLLPPAPGRLVCARSTTSIPPPPISPLPGRREGQRLYRRSLPPLLFLSSNSVCFDICQHFHFYFFSLPVYFRPALPFGWSNRELALPSARHCPSSLLSGIKLPLQ